MREYMERMMRCGIPPEEAMRLCASMVKEFGYDALEELTVSIEEDYHVA